MSETPSGPADDTSVTADEARAQSLPEDSPLHDLDSWLAGARSLAGARAACLRDPLVDGGDVVLTQYVVDRLDHDHSCPTERPWRRPLSGPD